ncbi:acyl-CoA dehydrogenase [Rhodothalassium salexigens]|uniref:acyl-CoA dehydrogenase n=1 Tax=Rhodothalassium salexigens TaxID=1086 RepID=UPI001911E24F|nr:acyl-CoA dehydrogenase [Rhodothalassium salexigens]MBK5912102.1 acyl-CoA dehydrogenase [Rhodothalassium salexigens]MBK5921779.1 acyl-CoA dehydrogenase [Rhodothalassium salexigens]
MSRYAAPVKDMRLALDVAAGIEDLARIPQFSEASADLVDAVLDEAGKLAAETMAPLNALGDRQGAQWDNGVVRMPEGFKDAYDEYVNGGWNGLTFTTEHGGQGLPFALGLAVQETWASANMALSLCPLLNQGAVEALTHHGSEELKRLYLPKLISGEWAGTMNLTEPQAGSDVGALTTRAERAGDGTYRIKGQKIYITFGEHDLTGNIVHLVLARLSDAPEGTRGISCFVVPKFLPDENGQPGQRNDLRCSGLEHKLGIHASPTCTMQFGDNDACVGWLVGEENKGLHAMFTMMNHARICVGLQGVAIAERAYQQAVAFAQDRVQSAEFGSRGPSVPIIQHALIRRKLMTMKSTVEAMRALTYATGAAVDRAHAHADADERAKAQGLADLLTPVVKAWCTDMGVELTSENIQIHGGMGFIEESGAPQHYRDARIAPIYEGTNGIQAMDLVGRKLTMDDGRHWKALFAEIRGVAGDIADDPKLGSMAEYLSDGVEALQHAAVWLAGNDRDEARATAAGASPFLTLFGTVAGGYYLALQAREAQRRLDAGTGDPVFLANKIATARFFAEQCLPPATALLGPITRGDELFYALEPDQFAA